MYRDLNHGTVTGSVTRDAELRQVGGKQLVTFTIASADLFGDPPRRELSIFHVDYWTDEASALSRRLRKGRFVGVTYRLRQRRAENINDYRLVATDLLLLSPEVTAETEPFTEASRDPQV